MFLKNDVKVETLENNGVLITTKAVKILLDTQGRIVSVNDFSEGEVSLLEVKVSNIMDTIGISSKLKGYLYIRKAILLVLEAGIGRSSITKTLYPEIAENYNVTQQSVERCIRHAICYAWSKGNIEFLNVIFPEQSGSHSPKTTNADFIFRIADGIRRGKL